MAHLSLPDLAQQLLYGLDALNPDTDQRAIAELRAIATDLHTTALADARRSADAASHARVQLDILRTEINSELVDREANAARIAERQQFLFQRASALPGQLTAAERAVASATYVEAALVALCPHVHVPMSGCAHLAP